jgi:TPR repeat protein
MRIGWILLLSCCALHANVPARSASTRSALEDPGSHKVLDEAERDYRSGVRSADGDGVPQDYAQAARQYRRAAEKGYIPAQYNLAYLYENGLGVEKNPEEAVCWYRRAAEKGDAESQVNLGALYSTGTGVAQSDTEAARLYALAAEQGDLRGLSNLGSLYLQGRGVKHDVKQAFVLFEKAAKEGYAVAQNNLALLYANGQGVARNYEEAYAWLTVASDALPAAGVLRDKIASVMTAQQIDRAKALANRKREQIGAKSE